MNITDRQRKIMLMLLQGEVKVKDLSQALDVSTRTIHRDLNGLEKVLFQYHLQLEKKPGVGLRILGYKKDKQILERVLTSMVPQDYTQKERQAMILSILFEAKEPVKLFTLANDLDVTIATVSHDLDQLEEQVENFHLSLIRRRGYGVKLEGAESNKRSAITHLISNYVDPYDFITLLKENIQNKRLSTISNRLFGHVNPEIIQVIEKSVEWASAELPYELADSSYFGLVIHLALALERLQKGDTIQFNQSYLQQIKGTKEYIVANKIIRNLGKSLSISIPEDEIGYITMHLMGAKLREEQNFLMEVDSMDIVYRVKNLIAYVSEQIQVDLTSNNQLLNDLITHLKPAVFRIQKQMVIRNPMIDQIKQDYQALFQLLDTAVKKKFPDLDFPEDEIGYLVLHFAAVFLKDEKLNALVICSSGLGTAKILSANLMRKIPQIKQIENKSLFDIGIDDLDHYDLIISTVLLEKLDRTDYILVSPMLNQSEVNRIKKAIRQKTKYVNKKRQKSNPNVIMQLKSMKYYTDAIDDIISQFYVDTITEDELVIKWICTDLEKRGQIANTKTIYEKLLAREKLGGLGIPDTKMALYHTRSEDVDSLNFSIYTLKHPTSIIGMDGENMEITTILMMLAPEETPVESLEVLSYLSSLLIQNKEAIKLFESANEGAIRLFLAEQFQMFLREKQLL